jgi:hypothetical protein
VKSLFTLLREALNGGDIQAAQRLVDELEKRADHEPLFEGSEPE